MNIKEMHDNTFNVDIVSYTDGDCKLNIVTKKRRKKVRGKEEKIEITIDYILCHPDQYNSLAPFGNFTRSNDKVTYEFDFSYIKIKKPEHEEIVKKNTETLRAFLKEVGIKEKPVKNYEKRKPQWWWEE